MQLLADQEIEQMGAEELCERAAQLQQTLARVLAQLPIAATRQAEVYVATILCTRLFFVSVVAAS